MKKLVRKLFIFLSPILFLIVSYFIEDPFCVLYDYDNHFEHSVGVGSFDYFTTERFLNNIEKGEKYDSFIFGSSRSQAFRAVEWREYIDSKNVFHMYSSSETLYGIHGKIKLLDKLGVPIKNVLIPCDVGMFSVTENRADKRLYVKHPSFTGQSGYDFQKVFFAGYFENFFFVEHLYHRFTGDVLNAKSSMLDLKYMRYNTQTNDVLYDFYDFVIKDDSLNYYNYREDEFKEYIAESFSEYGDSKIDTTAERMLREIRDVFEKHGTNYKLVLYPIVDKKIGQKKDQDLVNEIFGMDNIYDFSTRDTLVKRGNFYEKTHFKPFMARIMLKEIYGYSLDKETLNNSEKDFVETKYEFLDLKIYNNHSKDINEN